MVKTDELCSCKYPHEVQAMGTRGICQSCDREIFQGPRNSVERYLYNRILATEAKLDKAVSVIEKYKNIAWMTGGKITREESMAAQTFLAEIGKG